MSSSLSIAIKRFLGLNPYTVPSPEITYLHRFSTPIRVSPSISPKPTPAPSSKSSAWPAHIRDATVEQLFDFDPSDRSLRWKHRPMHWFHTANQGRDWNRQFAGKEIYQPHTIVINKFDKKYALNRSIIVQYFETGEWPNGLLKQWAATRTMTVWLLDYHWRMESIR